MKVKFNSQSDLVFKKTLYKRVNDYFTENNLSRHHTQGMIIKTIVMILLYLVPFLIILTAGFPVWANYMLYFIMGIGVAGIGMSVMHDGNHAGYSGNQKVNKWMGFTMNMIGADAYNWKIKHNKLHHVFTNIYNKDEDINSRVILRFAYAAPLRKYHRFQHLYAWFFYALMTLAMVFGDINRRISYRKKGITNLPVAKYRKAMFWLIISKVVYFFALIGLPLMLTNMLWWQVLIGFLILHITTGIILAVVFQMAHVVEGPGQALPNTNGNIEESLIVHQLKSTADFSKNNKWLSWYVGGLNFQIEHHLFPRVCHVHYPAIAKIVEKTTAEFNVPYYVYDNFTDAFVSHYRTLKKLGRVKV
ncbi:MAG: fatty acid desaturase family protein [Bacteroidota bacterium]